jgi:WD40-like Beta Propeller Repeat
MKTTRFGALAVALAVAAVAAGSAVSAPARNASASATAASSGSILYEKGGKLWVASPDGRVKRRVPHSGTFEWPSQADNGTIVAQRGINFHRLSRSGRELNKPITTSFRTNPILPAYKGPFAPQVSPDGTKIAYTYSFTAAHFDPACNCQRVSPSLNTSYTYANRFVEWPDRVFGLMRFHANASWIDNRTALATTEHLFDYAGNVMDSVGVDTLGGGADSYKNWFSECVEGCDSIQTLRMYRVDEGEMTRQRDKLVFTAGDLDGPASGKRMFIYRLTGAPTKLPGTPCHVTGASGKFTSPTWSPDGKSLAWADKKGIWVGRVGAISGQTCQLTRKLVIPGGSSPDWGPAKP